MTRMRIELPYPAWPETDRDAWEDLFHAGDLLDGQGAAVHWAPATRRTNAKHYARWLGWLAADGLLGHDRAPSARVTREKVEAYARDLMDRVAPRTTASALIGLKCVIQRMDPEHDWRWLKDLTNRLDRWARPSRDRIDPGMPASEMFRRCLAELHRISSGPMEKRRDQMMFRDTLLMAMLLICPIRLRNVAMMEIGRHLYRQGPEWHLGFEPQETKTHQPIHLVLPVELDPHIEFYLAHIRPAFPGASGHDRLWPACKGRPMAEETVYMRVRMRSRAIFGVPLGPHAFRSIAPTCLAESSPGDALYARPLLGHRQQETTERFYIRASQIKAARKVSAALRQIRDT